MLDIVLFRDPKTLDLVKESQRRRHKPMEIIDEVVRLDAEWRALRSRLDKLNRGKNSIAKVYGKKKKARETDGEDLPLPAEFPALDKATAEVMEMLSLLQLSRLSKTYDEEIATAETEASEKEEQRNKTLHKVGNIVHESVPVSNDEDNNGLVRTFGDKRDKDAEKLYNHVDLMAMIDGYDIVKGSRVAGNRGYFLKGKAVLLHLAIIQYAMNFLNERGYQALYTPFFMEKDRMADVAQLEQFDEELYKVSGEGPDKYLIATSEQTIAAYHLDEWMDPRALPIKYAGYSTCFRKEVGSHGRDTLGIFRVHQFEKIEQFVVTSPENNESWKALEEMIGTAEAFNQSLGLPYRVVNIVSGALNNAAAMKYDLEAWFPASAQYRELVSASNCTDYQARRLNCRFGLSKVATGEKQYVHMLNATLCATTRTICCILENYQTATGIRIPPVLVPFMQGIDFIPFVKPVPAAAAAATEKK